MTREEGRKEEKKIVEFRKKKKKKISKWTGHFSVNGLGLTNKQTKKLKTKEFEEKKVIVRISGKIFLEKSSQISVTFDNLEKMSEFF